MDLSALASLAFYRMGVTHGSLWNPFMSRAAMAKALHLSLYHGGERAEVDLLARNFLKVNLHH